MKERRQRPQEPGLSNERPDISILFDLVTSGEPTNIARDKDKMIGEAVWDNYLRKTGRRPRRRADRSTKRP